MTNKGVIRRRRRRRIISEGKRAFAEMGLVGGKAFETLNILMDETADAMMNIQARIMVEYNENY